MDEYIIGLIIGTFVMSSGYVFGRLKALGTWGIED